MKIALTFSGGGYRAAGFSLGALSYLYLIPFKDDQTLGDQVMLLSTVSGGTITGARYALGLEKDKDFKATFSDICDFLASTELVKQALENLSDDEHWRSGRIRSLISSFADVYQKTFFKNALFGELMTADPDRQLKHLSFNATEFAHGAQFRFQWSEKMVDPQPGEGERGLIGNYYYPLPEEVARRLRLGDILASSSCFPAGFEPINFPGDFLPGENNKAPWMAGMALPVGLMDGGVVDNQGLAPVLLAETRMQRNRETAAKLNGQTAKPATEPEIDLIFAADVASPYMSAYQQSKENKKGWFRRLRLRTLVTANAILMVLGIAMMVWSYRGGKTDWLLASTVASTLFAAIFLVFWLAGRLPRMLQVPNEFLKPLGSLLKMPVYVYESLLFNRIKSFKMLAMNVFLKHERTLNYSTIYNDPRWKNRRIMCAVYELRTEDIKKRQQGTKPLPKDLVPSGSLMALADKASAFGTTLWFTDEDLRAHMLNSLIACGQATACWNLLEYIEKIKNDPGNISDEHRQLIAGEQHIRGHWEKLKADPFCLLAEYGISDDWQTVLGDITAAEELATILTAEPFKQQPDA